jgi:UDP-glucose 4-epimerase
MDRNSHVIVAGGAGFIGSHLGSRLLSEGYRVTVLDNLSTGKRENIPKGAAFIEIDLGQPAQYFRLDNLHGDAVFHLASQSSGEASFLDPIYDFRSHAFSTLLLLRWCQKKTISRFLYASSMSTYGDPLYLPLDEAHPQQPKTFYAAGKISAEAYIKLFQNLGMNTTIFRLFSVYGPGQNLANKLQGMVSIFLSYMLEGVPVIVRGSQERFRDFIFIDDVVDAWLAAFSHAVSYGKTYNVASGVKTSIKDLIDVLKEVQGNPHYPVTPQEGTPGDQFGAYADISSICGDLNWQPKTDLRTGVERMMEFEKRRLQNGW